MNIAFSRLFLQLPNVSMHLLQNLITRLCPCSNVQGNSCHDSNDSSSKSSDDEDNDDDLFVNPNHQKPTTYFETDSSDESEKDEAWFHKHVALPTKVWRSTKIASSVWDMKSWKFCTTPKKS